MKAGLEPLCSLILWVLLQPEMECLDGLCLCTEKETVIVLQE